jgi:hypothetical protein
LKSGTVHPAPENQFFFTFALTSVGVKGKKQPLFCHFNKKTTTVFFELRRKKRKKKTITKNNFQRWTPRFPSSMKSAARCDTQSELQNFVSLQILERTLRLWVFSQAHLFQCQFLQSLSQEYSNSLWKLGRQRFFSLSPEMNVNKSKIRA